MLGVFDSFSSSAVVFAFAITARCNKLVSLLPVFHAFHNGLPVCKSWKNVVLDERARYGGLAAIYASCEVQIGNDPGHGVGV